MKRFLLFSLLITLASTTALAGGLIGFGVQANGAAINVPEPLKQYYGAGFGGGAHLDINLPVLFGIRVTGDYISFSFDSDKYRPVLAGLNPGTEAGKFSIDGGRISILSFAVNGKLGLPTPVLSPYATAGVGTATIKTSDFSLSYPGLGSINAPGSSAQTKFSANLGVGLDLNIVVLTLYLEAKYTWIFTEGEASTYIPVSLGITF